MKKAILLTLILVIFFAAKITKADYIFNEPKNLGPAVNSTANDECASLSADGLILIFHSDRPGGYGSLDLWMTTRATKDDPWGEAVNLGPPINSPDMDWCPSISPDGCTLYFGSWRPGGMGMSDIWVSTRATIEDDWSEPINLGPTINTSGIDSTSTISSDELMLYFESIRPDGYGSSDIWVSTRQTKNDLWEEAVNLGPPINTKHEEMYPKLSPDGLLLFFSSGLIDSARPGGMGRSDIWMARRISRDAEWAEPVNLGSPVNSSDAEAAPFLSSDGRTLYFDVGGGPGGSGDLYQVSIEPVVDLNGDGIVDGEDLRIIGDNWGTDNSLCDIGPMPWGDGIVDVQDLIVLAEHLFEEFPPADEINVNEENDGGQVELEQGQILVVTLESNPTTGYSWQQAENQEPILEQMGEAEFKPSETGEPPLVGAGGWEIFRFKAISAGQMTLKLIYHRPWEEGVEPVNTFSIEVVVN